MNNDVLNYRIITYFYENQQRVVESFAAPDRPRAPRALVQQRRRGVSERVRAQSREVFAALAAGRTVQDPSSGQIGRAHV